MIASGLDQPITSGAHLNRMLRLRLPAFGAPAIKKFGPAWSEEFVSQIPKGLDPQVGITLLYILDAR